MTRGNAPPRRENAFTLVKRLVSGSVTLARLEALRGRQEVTESLLQYRSGVILLAIAFGCVILAFIVLMASVAGRPRDGEVRESGLTP